MTTVSMPTDPRPELRKTGWRLDPRRSISVKLVLLLCTLFLFGVCLIAAVVYWGLPLTPLSGGRAQRRAEAFDKLGFAADLKKERVLRWLHERRQDIDVMAKSDLVRLQVRRLRAAIAEHDLTEAEQWQRLRSQDSYLTLRQYAETVRVTHREHPAIRVLDAAGRRVLLSTRVSEEGSAWRQAALVRAATGAPQRAVIGAPHLDEDHGATHVRMAIAHAVAEIDPATKRPRPGSIAAIVVADLHVDEISDLMLHFGDELGQRGEALLVTADARILRPLKHPLPDGSRATPLRYRITARPAALAATGEEGIIEAMDYRDVPVLAAFRYIPVGPGHGWGMVVKMDQDEVFRPVRVQAFELLVGGLFGVLVLVLFAVGLARPIARPLVQLSAAADQVAAGDLEHRIETQAKDEVGRLAQAFTRMTEALRARRAVNEATSKLSQVLTAAAALKLLLDGALEVLIDALGCDRGAVYLLDPDGERGLLLAVAIGGAAAAELSENESILTRLQEHGGAPLVFDDGAQEASCAVFASKPSEREPTTIICIALEQADQHIGVLVMAGGHPITASHREILEQIQQPLATAISNALANRATEQLAERLRAVNEQLEQQASALRESVQEADRQREHAKRASQLKSELLADVSHELRSPLNSILALSSVLLAEHQRLAGGGEQRVTDDKRCQYYETLLSDGHLLNRLINDLLDLSRIEAGKFDLELVAMSLPKMLAPTFAALRSLAEEADLEMSVDCLATLPQVIGDPESVGRVVMNLGSNAIKFTERGKVAIVCARRRQRLMIAVSDTGIGIDPVDHETIFEQFQQLDGSTTRRYQGSGLGLAIARKLVRMMNGEVELDSSLGKGSTFRVLLPIAAEEGIADDTVAREGAAQGSSD